jgi:hypothetical protein
LALRLSDLPNDLTKDSEYRRLAIEGLFKDPKRRPEALLVGPLAPSWRSKSSLGVNEAGVGGITLNWGGFGGSRGFRRGESTDSIGSRSVIGVVGSFISTRRSLLDVYSSCTARDSGRGLLSMI